MGKNIEIGQRALLLLGRGLLGLYFIVPGISKITDWSGNAAYMAAHDVPLIPVLLAVTIIVQVGGGASLLAGYRTQLMGFILAGLTIVINVYMHDFWNVEEAVQQAHETQNFIKNLAIAAGLMYVAGVSAAPPEANKT